MEMFHFHAWTCFIAIFDRIVIFEYIEPVLNADLREVARHGANFEDSSDLLIFCHRLRLCGLRWAASAFPRFATTFSAVVTNRH